MSSTVDVTSLLQQLQQIHDDHTLSYGDKEDRTRLALDLAMHRDDVIHLLGSLLQHSVAVDKLAIVVSHIEPYSRLYPDLWLSSSLASFMSLPAVRQPSPLSQHLLSMLRIGSKLVSIESIPAETVTATVGALSDWLSGDLEIAESAHGLLQILVPLSYATLIPVVFQAAAHHERDSTVYLRYLSFAAALSSQNEDAARVCGAVGFVQRITQFCRVDDVLLQINAMELVTRVATTVAGLEQLARAGTTQWLVESAIDSSAVQMVSDEALRVLASVFAHASKRSFQFVEHLGSDVVQRFLEATLSKLQNGKEVELLAALGVLSDFASISSSSLWLVTHALNGQLVATWFQLLNSAKVELQAATLIALAKVFDQSDRQYVQNEQLDELDDASRTPLTVFSLPSLPVPATALTTQSVAEQKQSLLRALGAVKQISPSHLLLKMAKQPIDSLRNAAMHLMRAIAGQVTDWGLHALFNTTGSLSDTTIAHCEFWIFLRDRATEFGREKEGKLYKFALIEAVEKHAARELLPEEVSKLLQVMVREGPYYMPPLVAEPETV